MKKQTNIETGKRAHCVCCHSKKYITKMIQIPCHNGAYPYGYVCDTKECLRIAEKDTAYLAKRCTKALTAIKKTFQKASKGLAL